MPKLAPIFNDAQFISGIPANGAQIFTYAAGSSTKLATYTDDTGVTPQANPIILNARGEPASPIWLADGLSYKFVFTGPTDSDPPVSPIRTIDDVTGINDASVTIDQWVDSGVTPTYVSATQFTVPGDQTSSFQVGRRIKANVTAGTVYGRISAAVFAALTTVTVVLDSGALDSGLSSVLLGLITPDNTSIPVVKDNNFRVSGSSDKTKLVALEVDGITTATTRVLTIQDKDITVAGLDDTTRRSYLAGLTLSTAGSSATMSIAAGEAADSANAFTMKLASAISKTTSAWAVGTGNGGIDTGAIANNTWYYFYVIRRPDTSVVDVIFSANSSLPSLPSSYTQYRYIGSGLTNGSAQWVKFTQVGDEFWWDTPILDFSGAGVLAGANLTCTLPRGRKFKGFFNITAVTNPANSIYISDPDNSNLAPSLTVAPLGQGGGDGGAGAGLRNANSVECFTNTSAQIRHRAVVTNTLYIATKGWLDYRGRMD